ncbi:hypothetical protein [Anaerotignum sp.]|uniref:hypothetical protein n=1 Tax=Anaerotignum sp. TaxID=2039241 RepID=UPI0028AB3A7B|nr:hypothetical protein [Anaerotignum sp.]
MKKVGVFLCCQSLLTSSIVIGLATIAQCTDKIKGDYYTSAYFYISMVQWSGILIPFLVGVSCYLYGMFHGSHQEKLNKQNPDNN